MFLFFSLINNNLNALPNPENIVIDKVIQPIGASIAHINDAKVISQLVTSREKD